MSLLLFTEKMLLDRHPRKTILPTPPGITAFDSIQWANDLNGDGWDDIFYYGYDGSLSINIGRYDLQSLAPSWSHSDANLQAYLPRPINGYSKAGPPDLNGDGVGDFLCCYELLWSGPPNPLEYLYRAYSGTDGSILWERILSSEDALCSHSFASDFNGNGTIDFIRLGYFSWDWQTNTFKSTGFLEAIDGGTGQSLWRIPSTFLDPNWLRGINPEAYATPSRTLLPIPDVDLDGVGDILTSTLIITPSDPFRRMQFVAVSGKSGAILRRYDLPNDVRVWSPDPIRVVGNIDRAAPVGDLDNDGWPEIGIPFATPSLSANGSLGIYSHGLCFLSIPSLNIDNKVSPNGLMKCGVSVPSMPNSQFIMLGSTSCNPRGGVSVGRWKSVLQPSPALAYSTRNPHTGWLDSNGRSSFNLRVPPLPPSLGQDLHFQAIVFDNGPNRRVKTITNLESVRI